MELRKLENENNNNINVIRTYKHKHRNRLCYCCDTLQEKIEDLHSYNINDDCSIQLCNECNKLIKQQWLESDDYDNEIISFVKTFLVENQEYTLNGYETYPMDRQDWIDMTKGLWSDEMYEEYGMYSPRQIKAYNERFITCQHPINIEYKDSKGCSCVFSARGIFGQQVESNVSTQCYKCEHYKKRDKSIKTMTEEQFNIYSLYYIGKLNYLKYKDIFEN